MINQVNRNAATLLVGALAFFLVGGLATPLVPALAENSWVQPVETAREYAPQELRGRAVYVREGCWYCHTQQIRTLEADTKRYGWRGVDAPISVPGEYVYDSPHLLGTRRIGPDLARVGGKYSKSWHKTHFNNPRDLVPGSVMPPFPWLVTQNAGQDFEDLVTYVQTLGRARNWRPEDDYEQ